VTVTVTVSLMCYGNHPYPLVTVKVTPSETFKRVAPDKEGAADKQYLGRRRKTLISNRGSRSLLSLFMQIHLGKGQLRLQTKCRAAAAPSYLERMMLSVSTMVQDASM